MCLTSAGMRVARGIFDLEKNFIHVRRHVCETSIYTPSSVRTWKLFYVYSILYSCIHIYTSSARKLVNYTCVYKSCQSVIWRSTRMHHLAFIERRMNYVVDRGKGIGLYSMANQPLTNYILPPRKLSPEVSLFPFLHKNIISSLLTSFFSS